MRFLSLLTAAGLTLGSMASAQQCGGSFANFVQGLKSEAIARGHAPATVNSFFASARQDQAVLKADRQQGVFQKDFTEFARHLISANRLNTGRAKAQSYDRLFDRYRRTKELLTALNHEISAGYSAGP